MAADSGTLIVVAASRSTAFAEASVFVGSFTIAAGSATFAQYRDIASFIMGQVILGMEHPTRLDLLVFDRACFLNHLLLLAKSSSEAALADFDSSFHQLCPRSPPRSGILEIPHY